MSGTWRIEGYPQPGDAVEHGLMFVEIEEHGDGFSGRLGQLIFPAPCRVAKVEEGFDAEIAGTLLRRPSGAPVVMTFTRRNLSEPFSAVFTGLLDATTGRIVGGLYNTSGHEGRFIMVRGEMPTAEELRTYTWDDGYRMPVA